MITAFIFDLDGTLVQTEPLRARSHARTALALRSDSFTEADVIEAAKDWAGIPYKETLIGLMQRFGLEEAARQRMAEFEVDEPWQVLAALDQRNYAAITADPQTLRRAQLPHAVALLHWVRRGGYKTGLATMSTSDQARRVLEVVGLAQAFDCIATCDDVERGKPDPEIFQFVARKLGAAPAECLVIEDSAAGVQGALAAGMWCIAVPNDFTHGPFDNGHILDECWIVRDPGALSSVVRQMLTERQ